MADLLVISVIAGGFAAVLGGLVWLGRRVRRRGVVSEAIGGAIGPFDEIFRPLAHRSRFETEAQEERMAPMPSPDDKLGRLRHEIGP